MPKIVIDNFATGIRASAGYTNLKNISASEMINFEVDKQGRLVCRKGCKHMNASELPGAPKSMFRAYYPGKAYFDSEAHLIVSVDDAQGLWYWDEDTQTFQELKNSSDSPPSSVSLLGISSSRFDYAIMNGRLFMGLGASNKQFWVKISNDTPELYNHGISIPSSFTATATTGGSLTTGKWYGYVVTFYRDGEEIESRPSAVVTVFLDSGVPENAVDLSSIPTSSDGQVTQRKIYRTKGQNYEADARTATLYYLDTIADNTTTTYSDTKSDDDLTVEIDCEDHDLPPQWHYCCNHAGRLWVADDDDDYLYFSKMDNLGTPLPDAFPVDNVGEDLIPYLVRVGYEDGDPITGLWRSPIGQQLVVFKQNSVCILYGNDPSTIDASYILTDAGCVAPWSIAQLGGLLFFLTAHKQIWVCDGRSIRPISMDVDPILESIPDHRLPQCAGAAYQNKYMLCFPSGDNENDRILVYDAYQKYWTMYDLPMNDLSWWREKEPNVYDRNRLVGARSDSGYVDYLFQDETGADITDDNGSDITCVWQTNWIEFPSHNSVITAIYIYPIDVGTEFTIEIDRAHEGFPYTFPITFTTDVSYTFTPAPSNRYRQGCYSQGRLQRIRISAKNPVPIERIELEYVVK